jgi:hypothetical protein
MAVVDRRAHAISYVLSSKCIDGRERCGISTVSRAHYGVMMVMPSASYYYENMLSTERVVMMGEQVESLGSNTLLTCYAL